MGAFRPLCLDCRGPGGVGSCLHTWINGDRDEHDVSGEVDEHDVSGRDDEDDVTSNSKKS